jgi:hypothetical protein
LEQHVDTKSLLAMDNSGSFLAIHISCKYHSPICRRNKSLSSLLFVQLIYDTSPIFENLRGHPAKASQLEQEKDNLHGTGKGISFPEKMTATIRPFYDDSGNLQEYKKDKVT